MSRHPAGNLSVYVPAVNLSVNVQSIKKLKQRFTLNIGGWFIFFLYYDFLYNMLLILKNKIKIIKVVNFLPRLQEVMKSKPLVNFLVKKKSLRLYHAIYQMFTYFSSFTGYEDDTKVVSSLAKMRKL